MTQHHVAKLPVAHASEAKNPDGSYDVVHMGVQAMNAHSNIANGHTKVDHFEQTTQPGNHNPKSRRYILDVTDKE